MMTVRHRLMGFGVLFSICLAVVVVAATASHDDDTPEVEGQVTTAENICDPTKFTEREKMLEVNLEPHMEAISFKCKDETAGLQPEEGKVFVNDDCNDPQTLLQVCPGVQLQRPTSSEKKYILTVSQRPSRDTSLYYKCESQKSLAVHTRGSQAGVTQDCIVKITVKGVSPATVVPDAHICVPKETGKDSTSVKELTLEADKQSIDFSCGNEAGAQLTPATSLKKFCADEGCQEQKELSSVWSDAALTTAGSGAATSYTLSIRSERKEDKDIYYKCSVPASNKTKVEEDGATGKEKSCVLKITVKSGETSLAAPWMAVTSCLGVQIMLGLFSTWM
ncbi:hypothetical protein BESB_034160 [Besnoitia besnoiti]|uniref:SRS domain-containing protein n=1 Tax=Besnoitia besnoiti TaxID=94643 RepID=A0A2A9MEM3_BESBE|nr:hypothetical protein BESB_034160 [Besnoitia besnoiti]PFH36958.1 hypothetical protein BESB_034160 [Besnoitia besnoiti]